jgi:hypothetical protein
MKVVKTIDAQEKSMQKVFDALTKHLQNYPEDFATLYVGQKKERDGKDMLDHSIFIFNNNQEHFFKSHVWNLFNLMTYSELDVFKHLHNAALDIYKQNNEL